MTTVSNPNRNPARAEVIDHTIIRLFRVLSPWPWARLSGVCGDVVMFMGFRLLRRVGERVRSDAHEAGTQTRPLKQDSDYGQICTGFGQTAEQTSAHGDFNFGTFCAPQSACTWTTTA